MVTTAMGAVAYDITLAGFIVVAAIAVGLMLLSRHDKIRSIRFGFFFEHRRTPDEDDTEDLDEKGEA